MTKTHDNCSWILILEPFSVGVMPGLDSLIVPVLPPVMTSTKAGDGSNCGCTSIGNGSAQSDGRLGVEVNTIANAICLRFFHFIPPGDCIFHGAMQVGIELTGSSHPPRTSGSVSSFMP